MPRDYATYMWVLYKRHVTDDSPERRAFLGGPRKMSAYMTFSIEASEDTR